jgi:hypothetical protein
MHARPILVPALLVLVLGGAFGLVSPSAVAARSSPCPDRSPTVRELDRMLMTGLRTGRELGRECFGGSEIRIRAFANWPDGIGGTSASGVVPSWFEWPGLILFASEREVAPGYGAGVYYGIHVPPGFGNVENRYHGVWVDVTARFEHPLALTCRGYGPKAIRPSRKEAIEICKSVPVLTSIRTVPDPPDTAGVAATVPATGPAGVPWVLTGASALLGALLWRRRIRPRYAGQAS